MRNVYFVVVSLLACAFRASAFSSGAGGCQGDQAAVGGFHLDESNNRQVVEDGHLLVDYVVIAVERSRRLGELAAVVRIDLFVVLAFTNSKASG